MRTRAALVIALCVGIVSVSGAVASAAARATAVHAGSSFANPQSTSTPISESCTTSDLAMSTSPSGEDATVLSTHTRAVDTVTLSNNSSADCPDSGFIVLLLTNAASHPEPTLDWSIAGGGWHGVYLSWNPGIVHGNASCASPCWTAGMVSLDVPPHTTYTIDLGVTFNPAASDSAFGGAVYYTAQSSIPDGVYGVQIGWAYVDESGGGAGGSGSGGGGGGGSSGHGSSPAASAHASGPSQQTTAATPTGPTTLSPSASAGAATPAQSASSSATPVATASVAPVADVHAGGSGGVSAVITVTAVAVLALAGGVGFVLARRRRGQAS